MAKQSGVARWGGSASARTAAPYGQGQCGRHGGRPSQLTAPCQVRRLPLMSIRGLLLRLSRWRSNMEWPAGEGLPPRGPQHHTVGGNADDTEVVPPSELLPARSDACH